MRKFFVITLLMLMSLSVFAQDYEAGSPFMFLLNFTNFGVGTHLPLFEERPINNDDSYDNTSTERQLGFGAFEGNIELLKFGFEHRASNFGVELSPFKLFFWLPGADKLGEAGLSFVNVTLYWNLLGFLVGVPTNFYLAPTASLNYLFLGNEFQPEKYVLTFGLQSGIRMGGSNINYNVFSVETGYRRVEGRNKFFAGIKFDVIMHALRKNGLFI